MHEDNKIAQYLIRKGADPNYKDKDGTSLLMLAAQQGNIKFCKQFIVVQLSRQKSKLFIMN